MKAFGLKPEHLNILYDSLEESLSEFPDVRVWLFGSRAKGNYKANSDVDLTISSRSPKAKAALTKLRSVLEDSDLPYTVDVVWWGDMAKSFLPDVKKTRIPFWDPTLVQRRSPWRACPLGQSWVRTYDKPSVGITDVDGHCRGNPRNKDVIALEELKKIEQHLLFSSAPRPKPFKTNPRWGEEFDSLIAGWTAYWNHILDAKDPLDPSLMKILIASESSFEPLSGLQTNYGALGLVQLMPKTLSILSDYDGEIKDHFVDVRRVDLLDASVSICAGIRWLFHKKMLAKKKLKREVSWYEAILDYKGVLKQNSRAGKNPQIRKRIDELAKDIGVSLPNR